MNYKNILSYFKKKQPKLISTKCTRDVGYIRALVTFTDRNTCEMMFRSKAELGGEFSHNGRKYHRYISAHSALEKLQSFLSEYRESMTYKSHPGFLMDTTSKYHDLSVSPIESVQIMEHDKKEATFKVYRLEK